MGTEQFRTYLIKCSEATCQGLQTAGETVLSERYSCLSRMHEYIDAIDKSVRPGTAGFGTVGQATLRAVHGGPFDPINRYNR